MDTGYPAMIPDVQIYQNEKENQADLVEVKTRNDNEGASVSDIIPPCTPLKG